MNFTKGSSHLHKRKEPEELVADLLSNVTINPAAKKFRSDTGLYPIIEEPHFLASTHRLPFTVDLVKDLPSSPLQVSAPSPLACAPQVADEKAIVLYKPVNPPLFPGGPPAGSSELPIRVNTLLSRKGVSVFAHSPFAFHAADKLYEGLYKSKPTSSSSAEDLPMASVREPDNALAVIPWMPPASVFSGRERDEMADKTDAVFGTVMAAEDEALHVEDGGDEMAIDEGEEMAVEDVSIVTNPDLASSYVNRVPDFNTSWQHRTVLQPPSTSAM